MTRTILEFAKQVAAVEPTAGQATLLEGMAQCPLVVAACGRRSGKSLMAAIWAAYDASLRDLSEYLRPGEVRYVVLVAASLPQARSLFRTLKGLFQTPLLAPLVISETADELQLSTNVIIKVVPCSSRTARGLAISTVIFEELAHFIDSVGYQSGEAVYGALAPSVVQFGSEGRIICLGTPRGQRGEFWKQYQSADRREDAYALNLPTWEMAPSITEASLQAQREQDPVMWEQEYRASFLAGGDEFLPLWQLIRQTGIPDHEHGRRLLALDPAFDQDSFGLAIACRPKDSSYIYLEHSSVLKKPGFNEALDIVSALAHMEDVDDVLTDQMSHRAVLEGLISRGIGARLVPWTGRSSHGLSKHHRYGRVKALLAQEVLRLVDDPALRGELSAFTVSPSALSPGYSVEPHGPDDRADAAVLAISELARRAGERQSQMYQLIGKNSVPDYQEQSLQALYGHDIPKYAIDKVPRSSQRRSKAVPIRRMNR